MRSRILVIPVVDDLSSFHALVGHLGHYFGHLSCERIVIPIDPDLVPLAQDWLDTPVLPPGFDEGTRDRIARVRDALVLRPWPSSLRPPVLTSDLVLNWDVSCTDREPWKSIWSSYRTNRSGFDVDWRGTRHGASWFAEAAMILKRGRGFDHAGAQGLVELRDRIGEPSNAYLVGTGPSARQALDFDMSDGLRIVCNTVVLDRELMDHVRPHVLTFADPIFHFGPSTYAQAFQRALLEEARRHDFLIVTTERFAPLLRDHVPELEGRIVGLRQGKTSWHDNFDLLEQPAVRPYPNILTMIMLPLAASFSSNIGLVGFDGRAPDDSYFWRHGSTVQFGRELEEIKEVHPGFFELDYTDYYQTHVGQLEGVCRRLESRGVTVSALSPSYMPPLARRHTKEPENVLSTLSHSQPRLISLTPDWINEFGHFGPFERRIHQAAEKAGLDHVAVASAGLIPDEELQLPIFTGFMSSVLRGGGEFLNELSRTLKLVGPAPGSIVAMYAGDVWHLPAILDVAWRFPEVTYVVNLMKSHDWIHSALNEDNPWAESLADLLRDCLRVAKGTNVKVMADSQALVDDLERLVGFRLGVWPMAAISSRVAPTTDQGRTPHDGAHVVSPVHAHLNKGFPEVAALSERLRQKLEKGDIRLTVRFAPQPVPVGTGVESHCEELVANGATVIREHLSDEEFAGLVDSADVVLVPYRIRPFRTRTSGVVLDALTAGKPVVTVRGTWAGELVERHGAGLTYAEGDSEEMESALLAVIDELTRFRHHVESLRSTLASEFSPDRLIEFLVHQRSTSMATPAADEVGAVRQRADRLREMYEVRAATDDVNRVRIAVSQDERLRSVEDRQDRMALMQTSLDWHRTALAKAEDRRPPLNPATRYPRESKAHLDEVELVARIVDPDGFAPGRMVDVGAHHGSAMGHFLRRGWGIEAFEADVRHFEFLQDRFGNDDRVTLDNRAVQATSGAMRPFYISEESTGVGALAPFLDSHVEVDPVETVSLADALDHRHVTVLKVDTEGFDLEVLRGFPWDRDTPDVVVCEFEDRKTKPLGYSTQDLGNYLIEHGYQVWMSEWHPVIKYGQKHDWRRLVRFPNELLDPEAWGNFIAFREPISERKIGTALAYCLKVEKPLEDPVTAAPTSQKSEKARPVTQQKTQPRKKLGRRQAVLQSLQGALRPVAAVGLVLAGSSGVLALLDQTRWATAVGAAAIGFSILATVIVAVRLERRTR